MAELVWEMADSTHDDAQGVSVWALVSAAGPDHDLLAVTVRDPGSDPTRARLAIRFGLRTGANACKPTRPTTCVSPASTSTTRVLLPFACQVLSSVRISMLRNIENALQKAHCWRWATTNSNSRVKNQG